MSPSTISEKGGQQGDDDYDPFDWTKDSESSDIVLQQQSPPFVDVHSTAIRESISNRTSTLTTPKRKISTPKRKISTTKTTSSSVIYIILLGMIGHLSLMSIYLRTNNSIHESLYPGVYYSSSFTTSFDTLNNYTAPLKENDDKYTRILQSLKDDAPQIEKVLIIACVPLDWNHVYALWTHLECVTESIDKVLISAPDTEWSIQVIEAVLSRFKELAGTLSFDLETSYYTNDRYDVGLWCDGLSLHFGYDGHQFPKVINNGTSSSSSTKPRAIFLINDSSVSLRPYNLLTEKTVKAAQIEHIMQQRNQSTEGSTKLVSLSGRLVDGHILTWVESVYRGFTPQGLPTFWKQSCERKHLCKWLIDNNKKKCIVDQFEKDLSNWYKPNEVSAMFPSYFTSVLDPSKWISKNGQFSHTQQWINGGRYSYYLQDEFDFPMRKVKHDRHLRGQCIKLIGGDDSWMGKLPYPSPETRQQFQQAMKESAQQIPSG